MQNSRINVNESGPDQVVVDFHNAAWQLTNRDDSYGFAYQKTLERLGLEPNVDDSEGFARLYLHGSTESVKEHLPDLVSHIGIIAHTGSRLNRNTIFNERDNLGRIMGNLTERELPQLPDNATLMRTVGEISYPFVEAVSSDGTEVYYARTPYWQGQNKAAVHEDGTPMRRFDARDIGGFVIGWDGLAVREAISVGIELDPDMSTRMRLIGSARGTHSGDVLREALREFIDMPDKPEVVHDEIVPDAEGHHTKHIFNLPRVDLKRLVETYEVPEGITDADVLRHAIRLHLAKATQDPDLRQKIAELDPDLQHMFAVKIREQEW